MPLSIDQPKKASPDRILKKIAHAHFISSHGLKGTLILMTAWNVFFLSTFRLADLDSPNPQKEFADGWLLCIDV